MKIGKKEFKRVDFDNEFTLEQGELGKSYFAEFLEKVIALQTTKQKELKNSKNALGIDMAEMRTIISEFNIDYICRVLAVSHLELIDGEWTFEMENFEANVKLFKKLNPLQYEEAKTVIPDFFTFIMKFSNTVTQTYLQMMTSTMLIQQS